MEPFLFVPLLFAASIAIGLLGSLAGVGGGVIFTPLFLAFTAADPDVVRSTGLALAMTTSVIAGARYLAAGLANFRIVLFASSFMAPAAIMGAYMGLYVTAVFPQGAALVRLSLGAIMFLIVVLLTVKRVEWPEVPESDWLAKRLGFPSSYWEPSLRRTVKYNVRNTLQASAFLVAVGLISGLFGLGGGWALVPVYNLVMSLPLKVAVGCSVATLAVGDAAGLWVYVNSGAVVEQLVAIVVPGVMIGAAVGSRIALRIRARAMRYIVVGVMVVSAVQLLVRGAEELWA